MSIWAYVNSRGATAQGGDGRAKPSITKGDTYQEYTGEQALICLRMFIAHRKLSSGSPARRRRCLSMGC
jgi:hypothetical protein